jgi:hypothetical protein
MSKEVAKTLEMEYDFVGAFRERLAQVRSCGEYGYIGARQSFHFSSFLLFIIQIFLVSLQPIGKKKE